MQIGLEKCLLLCQEVKKWKENDNIAADITRMPFRSNTFDGLVCIAVLHHVATKRRRVAAFRELARILSPGGRLFVTVWALGERHDEVVILSELRFLLFSNRPLRPAKFY